MSKKELIKNFKVRSIGDVATLMAIMVVLCAAVVTTVLGGFTSEKWWIIALCIGGRCRHLLHRLLGGTPLCDI